MREASVSELRKGFRRIQGWLREGEEVRITKRRRAIARLVPEREESPAKMPDFMAQLRQIYGDKILKVSAAELLAQDRDSY